MEVTEHPSDEVVVKAVHLRRKEDKTHLPTEVMVAARRKLGSHFVGRAPLRPLTPAEEKKYLPGLTGLDPDSREWEKGIRAFWNEYFIDVPSEGVVLNIGTFNGDPIDVNDWIRFKWVNAHKLVAINERESASNPIKKFFLFDPEVADEEQNKDVKKKKLAYIQFIKLTTGDSDETRAKIDWVFRLLTGLNPSKLNDMQKENLLEGIASKEPARFYAAVTDKDLEIRSLLLEMVALQVVSRIGNHVFFNDNKLGETLEEAIEYVKSAKNSETVAMLKAQLTEKRQTVVTA